MNPNEYDGAPIGPGELAREESERTIPTPAPVPTPRTDVQFNFVHMLKAAEALVKSSPLYGRFIDGTPLEYDIAVWLANSQRDAADFARTLERELLSAQAALAQATARAQKAESELQRYSAEAVEKVAELKAALAEEAGDKERLDWLETLANVKIWEEYRYRWSIARDTENCPVPIRKQTLRAAIDAARAEREGGGHV